MNFVASSDNNINYTDKNTSGKKPSADSSLVFFSFGYRPIETSLVIDPQAYKAYKIRTGIKIHSSLLTDAAQADRPSAAGPEFDPKTNNLG
jgi:hypothetical protein